MSERYSIGIVLKIKKFILLNKQEQTDASWHPLVFDVLYSSINILYSVVGS